VLAGFGIRGYDVISSPPPVGDVTAAPTRNSYAVYVKDSPGLVIQNNHILGGQGGDAASGTPGAAGSNGTDGSDGVQARECSSKDCTGETQPGGTAGTNAGCPTATQGNPGAGSNPLLDPQAYSTGANGNGLGGFAAFYAHGLNAGQEALCKYDCNVPGSDPMVGGAAQRGADGAAGTPGAACNDPVGRFDGLDWTTAVGTAGSLGTPGRGGGGGGAGGWVRNTIDTCTIGRLVGDLGGTGGGGGAGGCGGTQGKGARGGGGSFAIFIIGALPSVDGNLIDLGFGGAGGFGGVGGYGGLGGQGGRGGATNTTAWCAGQGGPGGRGGNGGAGSGGGGGCGGSVFGIAGPSIGGANYDGRNSFAALPMNAAGQGGVGGPSPAGSSFKGGDGVSGVIAPVQSL
jgi:hypothetical protein